MCPESDSEDDAAVDKSEAAKAGEPDAKKRKIEKSGEEKKEKATFTIAGCVD